jgi:hypothetical protein
VSLYFFWQHRLLVGLLLHLAPPILASVVIIYMVDLEPQRQSTFGQYVKKMMTHKIEAIRLGGDICSAARFPMLLPSEVITREQKAISSTVVKQDASV